MRELEMDDVLLKHGCAPILGAADRASHGSMTQCAPSQPNISASALVKVGGIVHPAGRRGRTVSVCCSKMLPTRPSHTTASREAGARRNGAAVSMHHPSQCCDCQPQAADERHTPKANSSTLHTRGRIWRCNRRGRRRSHDAERRSRRTSSGEHGRTGGGC